jgi:hypothetical protein
MKQYISSYLQILDRNELSDGTQMLHDNELPPPYELVDSDWKEEIIEIKPLNENSNRYGFVINGGIDTENGPAIVIVHINHNSKSSFDNGRTNLRLFDRILAINNIDLTSVTHAEAIQAFSASQGHPISLRIRRLNPRYIEYIDLVVPSDISNRPFGITLSGGLDDNANDPGLFITRIEPNDLLASVIKNNQLRIGDRLLEIKTNYTSANLQWVTHSMGVDLFRRICQDSKRVTLVVAHRTLNC